MAARINFNKGDVIPNTRLTFQHDLPNKGKRRQAAFICECGTPVETDLHWVRFLNIRSCGCYKTEELVIKNTKHSHAPRVNPSGAYRSWQAMHQRVVVDPNYAHVVICDSWSGEKGFINFFADMGDRPEAHTIERNDNSKGYNPSNCRWATRKEQAQNTSQNVNVTINGETHSINEWCRIKNIGYYLIKQRRKRGMSIEDAITTPINQLKSNKRK